MTKPLGFITPVICRFYTDPDVGKRVVVGHSEYVAYETKFGKPVGDLLNDDTPFDATGVAYLAYQALKRTKDIPDGTEFEAWVANLASAMPEEGEAQQALQLEFLDLRDSGRIDRELTFTDWRLNHLARSANASGGAPAASSAVSSPE